LKKLVVAPVMAEVEFMAKQSRSVTEGGGLTLDHGPRTVLGALKRQGPSDAASLASGLKITRTAVRQHLYTLAEAKLVTFAEESRPLGRPAKIWSLTQEANTFFADSHGDLTVAFVHSTGELFGKEGLAKVVEHCTERQVDAYDERIPRNAPLRRRLDTLVKIRNEEGFMAELQQNRDGTFDLIENHCPIAKLASACRLFCDAELRLFQCLLGKQAEITRSEHMAAEGKRCSYLIVPNTRKK
jgi:predicted ArsR family transcriptional regulator